MWNTVCHMTSLNAEVSYLTCFLLNVISFRNCKQDLYCIIVSDDCSNYWKGAYVWLKVNIYALNSCNRTVTRPTKHSPAVHSMCQFLGWCLDCCNIAVLIFPKALAGSFKAWCNKSSAGGMLPSSEVVCLVWFWLLHKRLACWFLTW